MYLGYPTNCPCPSAFLIAGIFIASPSRYTTICKSGTCITNALYKYSLLFKNMAKWMLSCHESQSLNSCHLREFYTIALHTLNSSYSEKTSWSARTWSIWDGRFFFWLSGIPKVNVFVYSSKGQDPLRQTAQSCCSQWILVCALYLIACRILVYLILDPLHLKIDRTMLHVCLVLAVKDYHKQ